MSERETLWDIEPHTEAKLDILRRYLSAWFPIMATYAQRSGGNRLVYVDGFAGPGKYKGGQDGSPVVALNTLLAHRAWKRSLSRFDYTFLCIESRRDRADHLKTTLRRMSIPSNVRWHVEPGEFDQVLSTLLASLEKRHAALAPAFVFIDPFGPTGFPMELVQQILGYRGSEVLITLNLRALDRWWLPNPNRHAQVTELFGDSSWRTCVSLAMLSTREQCMKSAYRQQLARDTRLYVRDFRQVNQNNQTSYYLVYATHHRTGLRVMKEAMWSVDPSGTFVYSDVTRPGQEFLFGPEFDDMYAKEYANELLGLHSGQTVTKEQLWPECDEHEHYLRRHLTRALDLLVEEGKVDCSTRRRGRGWPRDAEFVFPSWPSR